MEIKGSATCIVERNIIQGWLFDEDDVEYPLTVEIIINGKKIKEVIANEYRNDIIKANLHPTGKVGFRINHSISYNDSTMINVVGTDYSLNVQNGNFIPKLKLLEKKELCILHVGMHKTGSSSIQHNLSKYKFNSFVYMDLNSENHSIPVYSFFVENPNNYHIHKLAQRDNEEILRFNNQFIVNFENSINKNIKKEIFVISGEDIGYLSENSLRKLKSFLQHYFKKIQVFAYIREPYSYIASAFQERVKTGLNELCLAELYPYYRRGFEKFDNIFNKKNVRLELFDIKSLYKGDVTKDFLHQNSLFTDEENKFDFERTNESLTLEAVGVIFLVNKYVRSKGIKNHVDNFFLKVFNEFKNYGTKKFSFSYAFLDEIIKKNIEDVQWIEKRLNKNFEFNDSEGISGEQELLEIGKNILLNLDDNMYNKLKSIFDIDKCIQLLKEGK